MDIVLLCCCFMIILFLVFCLDEVGDCLIVWCFLCIWCWWWLSSAGVVGFVCGLLGCDWRVCWCLVTCCVVLCLLVIGLGWLRLNTNSVVCIRFCISFD